MSLDKLTEKLTGLPPLYYINLDHRKDKRAHMDRLVSEYKIKATRIPAIDGRQSVAEYVTSIPPHVKSTEIACTLSHLKAIRTWLTESDSDVAMICEDDFCLDTVMHWNFDWKTVMARLPYYWDIVQCCVTFHPQITSTINLHPRDLTDFSCVSYILNRRYAEKLMQLYWQDSWNITYPSFYKLTAEELIYRPGVCFSIPLFTYTNEFESSIQTKEHIAQYHIPSRNQTMQIWMTIGKHDLLALQPLLQIKK